MTVTVPHDLPVGIRIVGGVGPVRGSVGVGNKGCLTFIGYLFLIALAWFAVTWPYQLAGWGAEIPYLIVLVGITGGIAWAQRRYNQRRRGVRTQKRPRRR